MVRLVFRPYTRVRRSICTLESLRPSTRVSPGFGLLGHSSPSFGSRHICSHSNLSSEESWSVDGAKKSHLSYQIAFTLIPRWEMNSEHSHICQTPWSVFQDGVIRGISLKSLKNTTAKLHQKVTEAFPAFLRKPNLSETIKSQARLTPAEIRPTLPPIGSFSAISGTL